MLCVSRNGQSIRNHELQAWGQLKFQTTIAFKRLTKPYKWRGDVTKQHFNKTTALNSFLIAALICGATSAQAQGGFDEIVVSAQKRDQSIQDVPISVQVVDGETMRERNFNDLEDITDTVPTVTVTDNGVAEYLYVRGIGSGENQGFEQAVGTFVDGVYVGRGRQSRQQSLDVDRVEVLRGPQSVFFGNSAIAGAFNITTASPTAEWEGYASALYETELDGKEVEGAFGGPLTDTIGIRIAGRYAESDGWVTNLVDNEKAPAQESWAIRGAISWAPTDNIEFEYKGTYTENDRFGTPYESIKCPPTGIAPGLSCILTLSDPAGSTAGFNFTRVAGGEPVPASIFPFNGPIPSNFSDEFAKQEQWLHVLNGDWELASGHTVSITTGYLDATDLDTYDPDQSRYGVFAVNTVEAFEQFSQEIRLASPQNGKFEYIIGGYFHSSEFELENDFRINVAFGGPVPMTPFMAGDPIQLDDYSLTEQDEKLYSVFGQAKYYLTDALAISFGGRYTRVKKEYAKNITILNIDGMSAPTPAGAFFAQFSLEDIAGDYTGSLKNDKFMPEAVIEYDATDNVRLYAKYTEGFKAGGFDASFGGTTGPVTDNPAGLQFEPEEVTAYEIGAKTTLLDGSMLLNISAFRSKYDNLQVALFDATITQFIVSNAGQSVSRGVEMDMQYLVTDNFRIEAAASYLDAFYKEFSNGPCTIEQTLMLEPGCVGSQQDLTGAPLQFAPEFSGMFRASYDTPIFGDYEIGGSVDIIYSDEYFVTLDNDPDFIVDDSIHMNLRVQFSNPEQGWSLAFLAKNLTDRDDFTAGINWPGADGSKLVTRERPRTFSIVAGIKF